MLKMSSSPSCCTPPVRGGASPLPLTVEAVPRRRVHAGLYEAGRPTIAQLVESKYYIIATLVAII